MADSSQREFTTGSLAGKENAKKLRCPYLEEKVIDSKFKTNKTIILGINPDGTPKYGGLPVFYLTTEYMCKANERKHSCVGNQKEYEPVIGGVSIHDSTLNLEIARRCPIYRETKP